MKKFRLESHPGNAEKLISPWIRVYDQKNDLLCIIFADGRVSFSRNSGHQGTSGEWEIEEMKQFIFIAENFQTFFGPLETIAVLKDHVKDQDGIISQLQDEVHYFTHNLEKT